MTLKNIGILLGIVVVSGAGFALSGHQPAGRVETAAASRVVRVTKQEVQPAPLASKHQSVAPVGQLSRTITNAEREPIVPSRNAGTTAPTGELC
ncbi:hypothetical protein [Levilactobacillus angrenensis]|uniref:Uncharacterized protein n=1 Tax=Levilactobacillus angrenensis TaxID=2486020 RepID=A0ABW1UAL6_9LACO|nr:hypothetical protein [Levilactobacillus angrenensis]